MNRASSRLPTPVSPTRTIGRGSGARRFARATVLIMAAEQATTLAATATWTIGLDPWGSRHADASDGHQRPGEHCSEQPGRRRQPDPGYLLRVRDIRAKPTQPATAL